MAFASAGTTHVMSQKGLCVVIAIGKLYDRKIKGMLNLIQLYRDLK